MTDNLVNVRALSKNVYSHVFEQTVRERTRIRGVLENILTSLDFNY